MKHITGFNIKRHKKIMVSDIIKFYEVRGYTLTHADSRGMKFKRGSLWGSLTSLNPVNWKTAVSVEVIKRDRMDYDLFARYRFSTLGQFISNEEKDYFSLEVDAFEKAISQFDVDVDKSEQLAQTVSRSNLQYLFKSIPVGVLISLATIFVINIFISGTLSFTLSTILTAIIITSCYFLIVRSGTK